MEQSLFYSCLFIVIVATSADDSCITWPSNMKSIKTCCHLPTSVASFEEQVCLRKCLQPEKESEDVRSCIEDCFIATSPLLTKDKEINKGVALYSSSIFPSGFDSLWETKINASLDKCDFDASVNLSFGLAQYFHCVRENLIQNCVLFKRHVKGCSLTEEHFKKCKNIELNCSEPIEHFAVEHCCVEPVLIREPLSRDCECMCRKAEFFGPLVKRCFLECITNETNLVSEDGNLHIEAAKALLFANANKNDEWEKPIAVAVEACGKDLEESVFKSDLSHMLQFAVQCISDRLRFQCPAFHDTPHCRRMKEFANKCPEEKQVNKEQALCWMGHILACSYF